MKNKTFLKLCAAILACCSVFGCMIFTASAEGTETPLKTKWDFGSAAMGLEIFKKMNSEQSTIGYEYIAFSKTNDFNNEVLENGAGVYPVEWGEIAMPGYYGFIPKLEYKNNPSALPTGVNKHWVRYRDTMTDGRPHGAYVNAQTNSISPGIAFTANQTGTIRFELQYSYDNASLFDANKTKIWVGKADEMKYANGYKFDTATAVCSPDATEVKTLQTWTLDIDVEAGDKVCFVVQYKNEVYMDVLLHLKSAEYICGDLNANPITYVCAQESAVADNTFDVRLSSAVCAEKAYGKELGYYVTVKQGGQTVIDDGEISVKAEYVSIAAYSGENKIDELGAMQKTTYFCGILRGLSASGTVTVELSAFAGDFSGPTVKLTYENGVFVSSETIK